jgi:hypothetical protein
VDGVDRTGEIADLKEGKTFEQMARDQLARNAKRAIPGQVGWPELPAGGEK